MAGLVPAIHVCGWFSKEGMDARHKAGHDNCYGDVGLVSPHFIHTLCFRCQASSDSFG